MKKSLKKLVLLSFTTSLLAGMSLANPVIFAEEETTVEETEEVAEETKTEEAPVITKKELAEANGQDGNPAYIAVFGTVYDVTDNEAFPEGEHNGVSAGTDATEAFTGESPHEDALLEELTAVGRHIDYVFTEETLAEYNGQDGKPAYVAVEGLVYDMTNIGAWEGGEHNGLKTGTDATEAFTGESPHEAELLETLPIAGKYE